MYLPHNLPDRSQGSTREPYRFQADYLSRPLDLSNADVTFTMVNADTGEVKLHAGAGAGSTQGLVTYFPSARDVDTPGLYRCQFRGVYSSGLSPIEYVSPWLWARIVRNVNIAPPSPLPLHWPPTPVNTYLTPPLIASAFDDEFRDGDPDLGKRGYIAISTADGLEMTRMGDVVTELPLLGPHQYNSSLTRSGLRVQSLSGMRILKQCAPGIQLAAHIYDPRVAPEPVARLTASNGLDPLAPTYQSVDLGYEGGFVRLVATGEVAPLHEHTPGADASGYVMLLELRQPTVTAWAWRSALIEPITGRIVWIDEVPLTAPQFETAYAGIELLTGPSRYTWIDLGFIRSYPLDSWFP